MIMKVFAVYDKKVAAYNRPMFFRSKGEAIRSFSDACNDEKGDFIRHSEDYLFCYLGEYDDFTGQFVNLATPEISMSASDVVFRQVEGDKPERVVM